MTQETTLIVGVGAATGQAVCRQLAGRCRLALVARSTDVTSALAAELPDTHAFRCDVADRDAWAVTLADIRERFGAPRRILVNTESATWGEYHELALDRFAESFDVNVVSLLQLVQALFPDPAAIAPDTRIMISSSPAAYQPPARFLGLAPSRVAQRVVAELLNERLGSHGLGFCVFSINGAIDEPKMRAAMPDQPTSYFIQPDAIARQMIATFDADTFPLRTEIAGNSAFA